MFCRVSTPSFCACIYVNCLQIIFTSTQLDRVSKLQQSEGKCVRTALYCVAVIFCISTFFFSFSMNCKRILVAWTKGPLVDFCHFSYVKPLSFSFRVIIEKMKVLMKDNLVFYQRVPSPPLSTPCLTEPMK